MRKTARNLLITAGNLVAVLLTGFLAGIFNIIPYLGPFMGTLFGLFLPGSSSASSISYNP